MLTFPAMPIHWYQIIPLHDGAQGCEQLVQNHYYAAAHQLELQSLDRKSNAQSTALLCQSILCTRVPGKNKTYVWVILKYLFTVATTNFIITSAKEDMFLSLFVCLLATLHKSFQTDLHEIYREGWQWASEQIIKFWW